ncbi:hypothetical protein B6U96_12270 [Archaeoglobales archaeon ex4484_92]|nr:MAG: hypothetical protein B6U96_12270 [Archaeoglobales archaeon ex4484_92]
MTKGDNLKAAVIGILISVFVTVIIFKFTETELTWNAVRRANPVFLLLALCMQVSFWLLWALRLKMIASNLGYQLSYMYAFETTMASMLAAAITPSSAGGEPLRMKMLSNKGVDLGTSAFVVITERILDSIFFSLALPIFVIITGYFSNFGIKVAGIFSFCLLIFIYSLYRILKNAESISNFSNLFRKAIGVWNKQKAESVASKVQDGLEKFRAAALQMLSQPKEKMLSLILLTILLWSLGFMIPSFILIAFGSDPFILYSYTAQLIIVIVSLIPLTPGSSGIAEVSMAYLYSNFVNTSLLGILVALWRVITYHLNIFAGIISINFRIVKSKVFS